MVHPALLWSRPYHHGLRYLHEGNHAAAERELTEAVRVAERLAEPDDRLGCSLAALAELCRAEHRYVEAEPLYRRAVAVEERALGPAHPYTRQIAACYAGLRRELAEPPATRCTVRRRHARAAGQRRAQPSVPMRPSAEVARDVARLGVEVALVGLAGRQVARGALERREGASESPILGLQRERQLADPSWRQRRPVHRSLLRTKATGARSGQHQGFSRFALGGRAGHWERTRSREEVWRWLVQIGADRGGFYSYDWLENLAGCGLHSADRVQMRSARIGVFCGRGPAPPSVAWSRPSTEDE